MALQLSLTRVLKHRRQECQKEARCCRRPLHLPCERSKITSQGILPVSFGGLRNHTIQVFHWAASGLGKQPASLQAGVCMQLQPWVPVEEEDALLSAICGCVNYSR